jgi:hypothetical protein
LPSHGTKAAAHSNAQLPALQRGLAFVGAVHTWAHLPQLDVSDCRSTQEPEQSVFVPQSFVHLPAWQTFPAPQAVLQSPQWLASADRFTHLPEHAVAPALHTTPQRPSSQLGAPLGVLGQA